MSLFTAIAHITFYTKCGLVIPFISNNPSLRSAEAASEAWREAKQSLSLCDCFGQDPA